MASALAWVLALGGGLLCRFAFPDPGWWPLAPVAVTLLTLACWGRSARRGGVLGLVFGLAFFVPLLSWSGVYVGVAPWFALAVLQSLYLALLGAAVSVALRWSARGRADVAAVLVAALWVGQEALRDRTPYGGFPWARLAFSQADCPSATSPPSVARLGQLRGGSGGAASRRRASGGWSAGRASVTAGLAVVARWRSRSPPLAGLLSRCPRRAARARGRCPGQRPARPGWTSTPSAERCWRTSPGPELAARVAAGRPPRPTWWCGRRTPRTSTRSSTRTRGR